MKTNQMLTHSSGSMRIQRAAKLAPRHIIVSNLAIILVFVLSFFQGIIPGTTPLETALAAPAPVQIFYVTLPEANALTVLSAINAAAVSPVTTYFSIAISVNGTYVYYDQWENGYDSDIANPTNLYSTGNPGGTQIWGNGLAADGCAPNINGAAFACTDANDVFIAGNVIIPKNNVPIPRDSSVILFDARDKIGATSSIAMARAAWAAGSGTLNAFGHEMYATMDWGTAYESPVGINTAYTGQPMFEYSTLSIMASQNDTTVQIDKDANGTYESSVALQEGGTILVTGINQGARVQTTNAAKPIQVVLVTGDVGSNYESRDMNLLPVSSFGTRYWSPVGVNTGVSYTPGPTRLFLYNPSGNTSMTFTCTTRAGTTTSGTIAARGVWTMELTDNQAAYCTASQNFFAIGTIDSATSTATGQAGDWSFTLYPDSFLSTDALIGLGLGKDPTDTTSNQNGSPLWVTTAVCSSGTSTYVYVDWDNNGTADLVDLNGDGDTGDTVDGISEATSNNGMLIAQLKSVRLFEPPLDVEPYDQSGARVWSRTTAGVGRGGTPGCTLALAWGQDPRTASGGVPGLDVGTSVPPMRLVEGTKSLTLKTDADGDGVLSPGDVATYTISIKNTGGLSVPSVNIYDTVPIHTDYLNNSTQKDVGSGWVAIPDDTSGTTFPLDVTGGVPLGSLNAGATIYVRFDVTLKNINVEGVYEEVTNCDMAYTSGGNVRSCTTNLVASNDWGDLPDTYSTSLAANGPRHSLSTSGLLLGANIDRDLQGQPSAGADGDDLNQTTTPKADDEDGVLIDGAQNLWQTGSGVIDVTVANGPGCLNGWFDFTNDSGAPPPAADGNFTKTTGGDDTHSSFSEHFINNVKVNSGTTALTVTLPAGTANSISGMYFRFRLSPTDGSGNCTATIAPTGFVAGGEVEDYHIRPVDLSVTKTDGLITVQKNQTVVYTLTISNTGIGTATGVTLSDTVGAGLSYVSSTCGTPSGSNPYTWSVGTLAAGASYSCTVTLVTGANVADGALLENYAQVSTTAFETNVTNNEASDIDEVLSAKVPNMSVTKTDSKTQVLAGDTLTYVISYANIGAAKATSVVITDNLPTNATYVSSTPAGTINGSTITWSLGTVNAGASGSVSVTVTVNTDLLRGTVIANYASISLAEITDDPDLTNNYTSDNDTVVAPYIILEKSVVSATEGGSPLTYNIRWENNSNTTAYNAVITDTLPPNTTLVAGSISGGGTYDSGTRTITWNLGDPAAYASGTVSFQVTVDAGAGGATQTTPTLSTETGSGSVEVVSKTSAYTSLPWCDSVYNPKCLTYRGLYQYTNGIGPTGWNANPRAGTTAFDDTAWSQPVAAAIETNYWLPASTLGGEWTAVNTTGVTVPNYTFFRQAFCLPLNATDRSATLSLASDDISDVYLNGVYLGQHTGAGSYSTLLGDGGVQSGINILAVRLLNNNHGGHGTSGEDHSGLLFNLQASYDSLRPFAYAPTMVLDGQSVTLTADDTALAGRRPFMYAFDFGDGTVVAYQNLASWSHTYTTPGTYIATVTARAQYGCTGTDQVTITVLPAGSNLLANTANVTYYSKDTGGTSYSGQSGAGSLLSATLGDRIWLDEDGDGVQDAGETGLANVKVTITKGSLTYTTYTDANGNYLFSDVPIGTYTVSVDTSTLPTELAENPTYDEDGGTMNTSSVTLTPGIEHMTADFGYNWAPTSDVTGNTNTGAIGDRIWIDADGDGVQDAEEMGLSGVTVELVTAGADGLFGTADDVVAATTTTNASGNYIFDGLTYGAYVVRATPPTNYTLTGDPDEAGAACTTCDSMTTSPILLAPGDVYVSADFGYKPATGYGADIGDQIWLDADGNGILNGSEAGIPGISVALIKDDGDGVYEPGIDLVVATDITDANGNYLFEGVPVGGDYLVWVNDTANVLGGLVPTYDDNGTTTANISSVSDLAAGGDHTQDFGYAPAGQTSGKGMIGDTIFLDMNNDGSYSPGEGFEGVTVRLYADSNNDGNYDAGERLVAQTTTDENGNYYFANLPDGSYVVVVDTSTMPAGVTNTVDPDLTDSPLNEAGVILAAGEVNLDQDFGYQGTNTVEGTIWTDTDADGYTDSSETGRLAGVTVVLRDSSGNIVATSTTDASGNYSFDYLPNGTYTVDVTDANNVLDGYWHSSGTPNSDGYSQPDALTVTLDGNETITYADFGYYEMPAAVGNWVWFDTDKDGIQDAGETGLADFVVTLTITWPGATTPTVVKTTTDDNGYYSFENLLLDENMDGSGDGEPTFSLSVTIPGGYYNTLTNMGGDDGMDSDNPNGESVLILQGGTYETYDFGFSNTPTSVTVSEILASAVPVASVRLTWVTASELDLSGFNVFRSTLSDGSDSQQVNTEFIPVLYPGSLIGTEYEFIDTTIEVGVTYYYWLEVVEVSGSVTRIPAMYPVGWYVTFLPAVQR